MSETVDEILEIRSRMKRKGCFLIRRTKRLADLSLNPKDSNASMISAHYEAKLACSVDVLRSWQPLISKSKTLLCSKKHKSWCQLPNGNWVMGNILSTSGAESIISLLDGKVNTNSIQPANPDILDGVDDLMQLSYLNEHSVLYNLQYTYSQDLIYAKAGPVLVAINPFKEILLYGNDYIEAEDLKD